MAKGQKRGNREAKKTKAEKPKALATASSVQGVFAKAKTGASTGARRK